AHTQLPHTQISPTSSHYLPSCCIIALSVTSCPVHWLIVVLLCSLSFLNGLMFNSGTFWPYSVDRSIYLSIYTIRPKVCAPLTITLLNVSFQIYSRVFAVIMSSTLLRSLSTRCWSVAVGICVHSATRALVRSGADVGMSRRSGVQSVFQFIPKVFSGVEVCARHLRFSGGAELQPERQQTAQTLTQDAEGKSGCSERIGSGFGKSLHTHPAGKRSSGGHAGCE
ncbi:hypothetical protein PHYPO_G00066560, partial [Pangasianodon hypophthalmus]